MKKSLLLQFPLLIAAVYAMAQSGALDLTFDPAAGADATVHAIAVQTDGKVLIGGDFTTYSGTSTGRIARLNPDGSLDATFNTGSGFGNTVQAIGLHSDGRIYAAGWFTTFNGSTANRIIRLNSDGSVDATFTAGDGPNAAVLALSVDADDRPVIGGTFATVASTARASVARLNTDGTLDTSFDPGTGANAQVSAIAIQPDGNILIAGSFTSYNGSTRGRVARILPTGLIDATFNSNPGVSNNSVSAIALRPDGKVVIGGAFTFVFGTGRNRIAALNADGSLDTGFNPGSGAPAVVQSLSVDADNRTVMGGAFATVNGIARNRIARLNADGSVDTGFNPGTGAASNVLALTRQADGRILMAGAFTDFNGTTRNRVARLYGCTLAQPGAITGQTGDICIASGLLYGIDPVAGAESYTWTLPATWGGTSVTASIAATAGSESGSITVTPQSAACGVGQAQTLPVTVAPLAPEVPICLVTVDTTSQFNIVSWEKPITSLIDTFYVYREVTTNNYLKIGAVPYDSLSLFNDFAANPNVTDYRYRITTLDTCGFESSPSLSHKTIHLQVLGGGNLQWTLYNIENQPNPVEFYRVLRDDQGNGNFAPISTTIPGGNGTYTDPDWASFANPQYVVEVTWSISCTSSRENVNINTTRSNIELSVPPVCVNTSSTVTQSSCGGITLNGTLYSSSGTFQQTIPNAAGCDSIITLNLTVLQPTSSVLTETSCGSFTLNGAQYGATGTFQQVIQNVAGCDSTITLNLTVGAEVIINEEHTICEGESHEMPDGSLATVGGTYTFSGLTALGCDSTYTVALTVDICTGMPGTATVDFGMFPNPASDMLTILLPENAHRTELVLRNMLGQDIHRSPVAAGRNELPLHGIAAGVYMVQVGNATHRLIIAN
jgi:uncharacterized delta-60 repeat protein